MITLNVVCVCVCVGGGAKDNTFVTKYWSLIFYTARFMYLSCLHFLNRTLNKHEIS